MPLFLLGALGVLPTATNLSQFASVIKEDLIEASSANEEQVVADDEAWDCKECKVTTDFLTGNEIASDRLDEAVCMLLPSFHMEEAKSVRDYGETLAKESRPWAEYSSNVKNMVQCPFLAMMRRRFRAVHEMQHEYDYLDDRDFLKKQRLEDELIEWSDEQEKLEENLIELAEGLDELGENQEELKRDRRKLEWEREKLIVFRIELTEEREELAKERQYLSEQREKLDSERVIFYEEKELAKEKEYLSEQRDKLENERAILYEEEERLYEQRDDLETKREEFHKKIDNAEADLGYQRGELDEMRRELSNRMDDFDYKREDAEEDLREQRQALEKKVEEQARKTEEEEARHSKTVFVALPDIFS